jgi:hypothetical protein
VRLERFGPAAPPGRCRSPSGSHTSWPPPGSTVISRPGEPHRVIFAGCAVKCPLCPSERGTAGVRVVAGGVPVSFHDQAFSEQGGRPVADGRSLGGSGEVDRLIWPGQVERLVRLGSEDLRRKSRVTGVPRIGQRLGEVPLGQAVLVAVVGNPANCDSSPHAAASCRPVSSR